MDQFLKARVVADEQHTLGLLRGSGQHRKYLRTGRLVETFVPEHAVEGQTHRLAGGLGGRLGAGCRGTEHNVGNEVEVADPGAHFAGALATPADEW